MKKIKAEKISHASLCILIVKIVSSTYFNFFFLIFITKVSSIFYLTELILQNTSMTHMYVAPRRSEKVNQTQDLRANSNIMLTTQHFLSQSIDNWYLSIRKYTSTVDVYEKKNLINGEN